MSGTKLAATPRVRPPRALLLLLLIGLADLVATAVLSGQGRIVERNPLMAPLLGQGVGEFVAVKLATLLVAGLVLTRQEPGLVRQACLWGSAAYAGLLAAAFLTP